MPNGPDIVRVSESQGLGDANEYLIDASRAAINFSLPPPLLTRGRRITLKKTDLSANAVRVVALGGGLVDGSRELAVTTPLESVEVESDGTGYAVVRGYRPPTVGAGSITVRKNSGANIGTRPRLNFIEGANVTLTIADDPGSSEVDITIVAAGGGGGGTVTSVAGGVGLTGSPEPIVAAGTLDLDINSLTTESAPASGDFLPMLDISVGTTPASQRKTSVANLASSIETILGGPFEPFDLDLQAIAAISGVGLLARTGTNTWAVRTLQAPAAGITITHPAGTLGDPTFALANDLLALENLAGTGGFAARIAANSWIQRNMASGVGVRVVDGDGISGNPTFDLDINDLATETVLAGSDLLPFLDVSVGTTPAAQRKITAGNLAAGIETILGGPFSPAGHTHAHSALTGNTAGDDHTQYVFLAGRAGVTNDFVISTTSTVGTIYGTQVGNGAVALRGANNPANASENELVLCLSKLRVAPNFGTAQIGGTDFAFFDGGGASNYELNDLVTLQLFIQQTGLNLHGDIRAMRGLHLRSTITNIAGIDSTLGPFRSCNNVMRYTPNASSSMQGLGTFGVQQAPLFDNTGYTTNTIIRLLGVNVAGELGANWTASDVHIGRLQVPNPSPTFVGGTGGTITRFGGIELDDPAAFTGTIVSAYSVWAKGAAYFMAHEGPALFGAAQSTLTAPAASALLELSHATKALLLTRAAGTGGIATPVNGMLHYDSTANKVTARENGAWVTFQPLDAGLTALASLGAGVAVSNGSDTWVARSMASGVGVTVTDGSGVSGNPTFDLDINDLTAESLVAAGDTFPFLDVSVGTTPAAQRRLTFVELLTGINVLTNENVPVSSDTMPFYDVSATAARKTTIGNLAAAMNNLIDHGSLSGLTPDDDHTQYGLLAGRSGGQTLIGGTAASEKLILQATSNSTRGTVDVERQVRFHTATSVALSSGFPYAIAEIPLDLTLSGTNPRFRGLFISGTATYSSDPSSLGMANCFLFNPTLINSGNRTMSPVTVFSAAYSTSPASGSTTTGWGLNTLAVNPTLTAVAGGGAAAGTAIYGVNQTGSINTGWTIDDWAAVRLSDPGGSGGVISNIYGLDVAAITSRSSTIIAAVNSAIAAGTGQFFLRDTGGAQSSLAGKFTTYNGIATEGWGLPGIVKEGNLTSTQTGNATIATYTPPATAGRYRINAAINTTSGTNTGTVQFQVDYTNAQGTVISGAVIPLIRSGDTAFAATGTAASRSMSMATVEIMINNGAANIVLKVVTTGTVNYTAAGSIERLS